ncbi:MAG: cytochrome P450 [Gammaproteobacteria bacterium]|nr:cytochrome P450 [Gammaproteobacteria bacterium]
MNNSFSFEPFSAEFARDPYSVYARMRRECPVHYHEDWDTWLLATCEDVKILVMDERLGRTMDHVLTPQEIAAYRAGQDWDATPAHSRYVKTSILDSEGELHSRLRKAVFRLFTPARVNRMRDFIQERVDRQIDSVESGQEFDFIEDLAAPIPGYVIGELLGIPERDRPRLRTWSEDIVQFFEPERTGAHRDLAERATAEFAEYLAELAAIRRKQPGPDLVSEMITWRDGADRLDQDELISTAMTILMAGHGSTIDAAGNGMAALFRHPRQLAALQADPGLIHSAVQEMLRYEPPLPYFHRYALERMEYRGYAFDKGAKLGFLYASASRDPACFTAPDTFDIRRDPNRHLAFGGGVHHCLGSHLARLNLEVIFNTVLRRLPGLCLAVAEDELNWKPGILTRSLTRLPVGV